ncbi:unnamed protein product [Lathyrus sativus]|nr:unnamed protein product [Lathyrus sativus]
MEEKFWRDKFKVKWPLESDRNTTFFHRISKIKQKFRPISMLMNGDADFKMVEDTIPSIVDYTTNHILTSISSLDEISTAVFNLNKSSAFGPYGFGAVFFQTYWDIIKHDVSNAVLQYWLGAA